MKITFNQGDFDEITIDTSRRDNVVYEKGSLIAYASPFSASGCPLTIGIAITPSGKILHRGWDWSGKGNYYLHTDQADENQFKPDVTPQMCETIAGLFSGRITIDGLQLHPGATVQNFCQIDLLAEEERAGKKIYLERG